MKRHVAALVAVFTIVLIAACSSGPSLSSQTGFQGTLPRAIGIGVYAPQCFFFCLVSVTTSQGDTVQQDIDDTGPISFRRGLNESAGGPSVVDPLPITPYQYKPKTRHAEPSLGPQPGAVPP